MNQEERKKERKPERVAAPSFQVPDWINHRHWDAWHSCPKRKKATNAQKQMAVDKLAKWRDEGVDYALALENAALAGWQGLFKPDSPAASGRPRPSKVSAAAATIFGARRSKQEVIDV